MKIHIIVLFWIFSIAFPQTSYCQKSTLYEIDTLVLTSKNGTILSTKETTKILKGKDIQKKAELFYNTGYALANKKNNSKHSLNHSLQYLKIAEFYYKKTSSKSELAFCIENQATIEYSLHHYEIAVSLFEKSIALHNQSDSIDFDHIAILHNNIAFIFQNTYRNSKALVSFTKALDIFLQNKDNENIAKNYYYKGVIFYEENELDSALLYYEKALEFDLKNKNNTEIIASYNNIAIVLTKQNKYNLAIEYLQKTQAYITKSLSQKQECLYSINLGNIYFIKKDYTNAIKHYQKALAIKRTLKENDGIAICLHNIGHIYINTNRINEAKKVLTEALQLTKKEIANQLYGNICKTMSKLYELIKDPKNAFYYYDLYMKNTLKVVSDDSQQISVTESKYDDSRILATAIQREIKMQEKFAEYDLNIKKSSISTLEEKRKASRTSIYIFIGILLFIIIGIIILFNRYLLKKKASNKLELLNAEIAKQNIILAEQAQKLVDSNQELEKLSIVASKTDNAILIINSEGYFEWVNEAFTKIFGYTYEELCEKISPHVISNTTPDYIKEKFEYCRSNKTTVQYEFESKNKFKETIWLQVTLTPILDELGELRRLVMIDSDITDIKKAEFEILEQKNHIELQKEELVQQRDYVINQSKEIEAKKEELAASLTQLQTAQNKLVESEKMAALGSLVAGISHEINTPVGVGTAASTTLSTRVAEIIELFETKKMKLTDLQTFLDTAQNACDLILKNLTRTAELVKSFNQVSVDNMTEQKRTFNLNEYLHDITRSLAPKFKGRPVTYTITCPENIEFTSFPGAFAQIFTNFIVNSLTHGYSETDKGIISILVEEKELEFVMTYSDDGKGIPAENQPKVFEAFFTTDTEVGTGLGMNITYNLITQKLGGEITLWSEDGKGVIFTATIPKSNVIA